MQILRPYQVEACAAVWEAEEEFYNRVLFSLPTGAGKTTVLAQLVGDALVRGWKVLVVAHRREILGQLRTRIAEHNNLCALTEIGMEIAGVRCPQTAKVVIGSIDTIRSGARLAWFKPQLLIVDEAHRGAAASYRKIATQSGVDSSECFYVGCTATAKRHDKQALFARYEDDRPVLIEDKKKKQVGADPQQCVFEKLVFNYTYLEAVEDGWLVPAKIYTVHTDTDLTGVKSGVSEDGLDMKEVQERVNNAKRTNQAIQGWKDAGASEFPALLFAAGVTHAHDSAGLIVEAGFTSKALDGETEDVLRDMMMHDFRANRLQTITNCDCLTEGADVPNCHGVILAKPTKSWNKYCQMFGRGTRPYGCTLTNEMTAEERRTAIAASPKPFMFAIDVVDISNDMNICTAPNILDLPVKLTMKGASLTDAAKLLKEFEDVKDQVIGECPVTYEELKVRLEAVELLRQSNARNAEAWASTATGYTFRGVRPGYSVQMGQAGENWHLSVKHRGNIVMEKTGKPGADFKDYLNSAQKHATKAINDHAAAQPQSSRGTLMRLSEKQANVLRKNGHRNGEIDAMPYGMARNLVGKYMDAWKLRQAASRVA